MMLLFGRGYFRLNCQDSRIRSIFLSSIGLRL